MKSKLATTRNRNPDGGRPRRMSFTLEQPVGRDMKVPLADLLEEATAALGVMGAGEPGSAKKKRWLARWAVRVVCEALLRQGTLLPLPWAADLYPADGHAAGPSVSSPLPTGSDRERIAAINGAFRALKEEQ